MLLSFHYVSCTQHASAELPASASSPMLAIRRSLTRPAALRRAEPKLAPALADDCDLVPDRIQSLGTDAGHVQQIVDAAERSVLIPVVHDRLRLRGTNA